MGAWKKIWLLGLELVFASVLAAQVTLKPSETYREPQGRFSVSAPEGWTMQRQQGAVTIIRGAASITLSVWEGAGPASDVLNSITTQIRKQWAGFRVIQNGDCPFGNRQAICTLYTGVSPNGKDSLGQVTVIVIGQRIYVAMESAPKTEVASVNDDLEWIKLSFSPAGAMAVATPQTPLPQTSPRMAPLLHRQLADDATYSVALPPAWFKTSRAVWEGGAFFGPQGDTLSLGVIDVYSFAPALEAALPGYQAILPPAQYELTKRLLAPPMDGMQIVTRLFPHVAGGPRGAIQNIQVLGSMSQPLGYGFTATLVHYQYTLLPQQDAAFSSMVHPYLQNRPQVPIEAVTMVMSFPVNPGLTWTFGHCTISAPSTVFHQNMETYRRMFENVALEPRGLAVKIRNNEAAQELAEAMQNTTREVGKGWTYVLGSFDHRIDPLTQHEFDLEPGWPYYCVDSQDRGFETKDANDRRCVRKLEPWRPK